MNDSINDFDVTVVGNGIAAYCLMWELAKSSKFVDKKVLQIYCDETYPACSLRTTAVVSLGVHEKGLSPLGDLLVDSAQTLIDFVQNESPSGIYKSKQFYIYPTGDERREEKFNKRYGDGYSDYLGVKGVFKECFLIDPILLFSWFESKLEELNFSRTIFNKPVVKVTTGQVHCQDEVISSSNIILGTSSFTNLIYEHDDLPVGKPVSGSYYQWDKQDFGPESFVLSQGHFNIVYRSEDQVLMFGGTSAPGTIFSHDRAALDLEYEKFTKFFSSLKLPAVSKASAITGIRHKGRRRTPFLAQCEKGIFVLNGLYKNGFSVPFYGAKKIIETL